MDDITIAAIDIAKIDEDDFKDVEKEYGCGYWFVCSDRGCPCALSSKTVGYDEQQYRNFDEELRTPLD